MIWSDIVIGSLAILYGAFTLVMRIKKPSAFAKLEAMKERFGEKPGYWIHVVFYSLLPLVVGGVFLHRAFQ